MARTSKPKRSLLKRRSKRKTYAKKRSGNVAEWASCSCKETISPGAGLSYTVNTLYSNMSTALINYNRASTLAQAYQHYRIKNIKMTFLPQFDTFASSGGSGSKPMLYYMIDKSGSIASNISLEGLKECGARPIALDEKPITISWAPSVLEAVMTMPATTAVPAKYRISPWLATDSTILSVGFTPSAIRHLGLYWYLYQAEPSGSPYNFKVEVEVQFQFKKPNVMGLTGEASAVEVFHETFLPTHTV